MPTENKRVMPEAIRRIYKLGEAFGALPESAKDALFSVCEEYFKDSHRNATDPDLPPAKRDFWCGANHQATEMKTELTDLMSGNWRNWDPIRKWIEQGGDDDEE